MPLTVQPWVKAPIVVDILRDMADRIRVLHKGIVVPTGEKLFVLRPPGGQRSLLNQSEIRAWLEARNYITVTPAEMTCAEQIVAFSAAEYVVGTIGAELTNIVFANNGIRLLGMTPYETQDDFFLDLVSHLHGKYFSLHGIAEEPEKHWNSAFTIPLADFDRFLGKFEAC